VTIGEGSLCGSIGIDQLSGALGFDDSPMEDRVSQPGKAIGSGGSTGRSKIIVDPRPWTAIPSQQGTIDVFGRRPEDTVLIGGPLYHNGPFVPLFMSIFDGSTAILMARFDAKLAVELIERHQVNWTFMVPTQMARIARLRGIEERNLSSLHGLYHSGSACAEWLKRRWIELIGADHIFEVFGSAEQIGALFMRGDEWLKHPNSVGRPESTEVRIIGADGADVPDGDVGEIYFRWKAQAEAGFLAPLPDPDMMYEYWGSPRLRTTSDRFATAGDLGWFDEEGYLHLADRRLDLIISGGSNVYPAEIEGVISSNPKVDDVAVIGLPDEDWGQSVHAIVQPAQYAQLTEKELDAFCRAALSPYKRPKTFEIVPVLPRDESGKIRRSLLLSERVAPGRD
jgi:bile acid-coenzyme A ligase